MIKKLATIFSVGCSVALAASPVLAESLLSPTAIHLTQANVEEVDSSNPTAPDTGEPDNGPLELSEPDNGALEISPAHRAQIEELIALTNPPGSNELVLNSMVEQFRQMAPDVPDIWWDTFVEKVDYDELNALVVPIYARHYTSEEVAALLEFYQTPIGQTVIAKTPIILEESFAAGQAWGFNLAQEILTELEEDGYELPSI
ncbi:MAG: DUF2059 domain-containing protein [Cyanobacteria bacterium J06573_11]